MSSVYSTDEPPLSTVNALQGPVVLEFGTDWCGFCRAAQPLIVKALATQPPIHYLKVEDGPGRPLGRAFGIKLWPTLIFLRDGQTVARIVRPTGIEEIESALKLIA